MAERNDVTARTPQEAERTSEQIRQDIVAKRETISGTVERLGERIQEKLDWRGYIVRYPYAAIGAAAGVGFLASALFLRRRRGPVEKVVDSVVDAVEDIRDQLRGALGGLLVGSRTGRSVIRGAISGAVSKMAVEAVKNMAGRGDGFRGSDTGYEDESRPPWSTSPRQEPGSSGTVS